MKNKFCFFNIIILVLVFYFVGTDCRKVNRNIISTDSVNDSSTVVSSEVSEISLSEASISESIEILETFKSDTTVLESAEHAEKQIVAEILMDLFGYGEQSAFHDADSSIHDAETLSEKLLGKVTSEEDAIEKARAVLIEKKGTGYIEKIESDFVEVDGEKIKYQRTFPPYTVVFYNEYDVWLINPNPPSGIREDGVIFATPAMPPYVILRRADGKVLAVC